MPWPRRTAVHAALTTWARKTSRRRKHLSRVGYFGSYANGNAGVGSDLDTILVLDVCDLPFIRRAAGWDLTELPVPVDVLVYSQAEWEDLSNRSGPGNNFTKHVVWVYER